MSAHGLGVWEIDRWLLTWVQGLLTDAQTVTPLQVASQAGDYWPFQQVNHPPISAQRAKGITQTSSYENAKTRVWAPRNSYRKLFSKIKTRDAIRNQLVTVLQRELFDSRSKAHHMYELCLVSRDNKNVQVVIIPYTRSCEDVMPRQIHIRAVVESSECKTRHNYCCYSSIPLTQRMCGSETLTRHIQLSKNSRGAMD